MAYQDDIIKLHKEKVKTIRFCKKVMGEAEVEAEEKSIALTDGFKKEYILLRASLEDDSEKADWREAQGMMLERNDKLEEDLMAVEMRLVENLTEAMAKFQGQVQGINDAMETKTTDYFAYAVGQNENYRQELQEHVKKEVEKFQKEYDKMAEEGEDEFEMDDYDDPELMERFGDPEQLTNDFDQMKDFQESKFVEREQKINALRKKDWDDQYSSLKKTQHNRSRNVVEEIILQKSRFSNKL